MANSENNFWQEIQKEISESEPQAIPTQGQMQTNQGYYPNTTNIETDMNTNPQNRLPFNQWSQEMPDANNMMMPPTPPAMVQSMTGQDNIQAILQSNLGYYVVCDFLIGTDGLDTREGILYWSGVNFLTLYHPQNRTYTVCDIYSLKFITFYNSRTVPPERTATRTASARQGNSRTSKRLY